MATVSGLSTAQAMVTAILECRRSCGFDAIKIRHDGRHEGHQGAGTTAECAPTADLRVPFLWEAPALNRSAVQTEAHRHGHGHGNFYFKTKMRIHIHDFSQKLLGRRCKASGKRVPQGMHAQ
jgi:hypothetical protein